VDNDGFAPVYIRYGHKSKTILFPTNIKIQPKYWSGDPDQPIKRAMPGYIDANKTILEVKLLINKISGHLTEKMIEPTVEVVKRANEDKKFNSNKQYITFFDLFKDFIKASENRVSSRTISAYRSCLAKITEFSAKKRLNVTVDSVNLKFYDDF